MALRPPPINAKLTRIYGVEFVQDDYGNENAQPVERWSGRAPAYSTARHENVPASGGGTILVRTATLSIPSTLPVEPGDSITFTHRGVEQTRTIDAAEDRSDAGFMRLFVRDAA